MQTDNSEKLKNKEYDQQLKHLNRRDASILQPGDDLQPKHLDQRDASMLQSGDDLQPKHLDQRDASTLQPGDDQQLKHLWVAAEIILSSELFNSPSTSSSNDLSISGESIQAGLPNLIHVFPAIMDYLTQSQTFSKWNPKIQDTIRKEYLKAVGHFMRQQKWLDDFIFKILPKDLPLILLKGSAFNGTLYPESHPRLSSDLDILVKSEDFERACQLLSEAGQKRTVCSRRIFTRDHLFEVGFEIKNMKQMLVELHRGLTQDYLFAIDEPGLWSRSVIHPRFKMETVRILSPEDSLLHLVLHSFRDKTITIRTIMDVVLIQRLWQPDTAILDSRARAWGCSKILNMFQSAYNLAVPDFFPATQSPDQFEHVQQTSKSLFVMQTTSMSPDLDSDIKKRTLQIRHTFYVDDKYRATFFLLHQFYLRCMDILWNIIRKR